MRFRRILAMGLAFMMGGLFGCGEAEIKKEKVSVKHNITASNVRVYGRNEIGAATVNANWVNSGIEIRFIGEELALEISVPAFAEGEGPYVQVWIDDERAERVKMLEGRNSYKVAKGLPYAEHKVKLLMVTENMYTPISFNTMKISAKNGKPECLSPEKDDEQLIFDVYGDSITAGFGTIPGYPDGYRTQDQDSSLTYAFRTVEHFGGDANFVAISGWGCYQGYGPDRNGRIPRIWRYASMPSQQEWDFSNRKADIVIVSLGTNDAWFWTEDMPKQDFIDAYLGFLGELRAEYPDAQFYCLHGMMDETFRDVVKEAARQYSEKDAIGAVYVDMPNMNEKPEYMGSGGHPSGTFGEYASKTLIKAIEENYKRK